MNSFALKFEYTCIYFCKFSQAKGIWIKSLGISRQSKLCTKKLIKLLDQEPDRKNRLLSVCIIYFMGNANLRQFITME